MISTDYCCDTVFDFTVECDRDHNFRTCISAHTITLTELKKFANNESTRMDDVSECLFSELLDAIIRTEYIKIKQELCDECWYDDSGYPCEYAEYREYVKGSGRSVCYVNADDFVDFKYVYDTRCRSCGKSNQVDVLSNLTIDQYHINDHILESLPSYETWD